MARDRLTPEEVEKLAVIARQAAAQGAGREAIAMRLRAFAAEWHIPLTEAQILELGLTALDDGASATSSSRSEAALARRAERDRRARERRSSNRRQTKRRQGGLAAFVTGLLHFGKPERRTIVRRILRDRRRSERRKGERRRSDRK